MSTNAPSATTPRSPPTADAPTGTSLGDETPLPGVVPRRWSRAWWSGQVPVPTYRMAALIAVAAVLSGVGPAGIGVLPPVLVAAVLLVVDARRAPPPWQVEVARTLPGVLPLDGTGEVRWTVRNPTTRRLQVAIADELAPSLGATHRRFAVAVAPGARRQVATPIRPRRRGTFRPNVMTVRVRGPLGLATRQAPREVPGRVEVHPRFRSRAAAELRIHRGRILEQGRRSARGRGGGTEFEALRDYVQGDEFRHIDWAASARVAHPVVRTHRVERDQRILVMLDTGRVVAGRVEGVPRLDHGMDAALALATVATALGDRVGLVAYGRSVHRVLAPRRDQAQLRRLSRELHALEPELAESDHAGAIRTVRARFRRRALIVLLTDLAPEAVEATLLPALPGLLRDHRVLVASVADPLLEQRLRSIPTEVGQAYAAAGAASVVAARARAAARLRGVGAQVLDAPPGRLAAAVADAYLDTKNRGGW